MTCILKAARTSNKEKKSFELLLVEFEKDGKF